MDAGAGGEDALAGIAHAMACMAQGRAGEARKALEAIGERTLQDAPRRARLWAAYARAQLLRGEGNAVRAAVEHHEGYLEEAARSAPELLGWIAAEQAAAACRRDAPEAATAIVSQWMGPERGVDPARARAASEIALAGLRTGWTKQSHRWAKQAVRAARTGGRWPGHLVLAATCGDPTEAEEKIEAAWADARAGNDAEGLGEAAEARAELALWSASAEAVPATLGGIAELARAMEALEGPDTGRTKAWRRAAWGIVDACADEAHTQAARNAVQQAAQTLGTTDSQEQRRQASVQGWLEAQGGGLAQCRTLLARAGRQGRWADNPSARRSAARLAMRRAHAAAGDGGADGLAQGAWVLQGEAWWALKACGRYRAAVECLVQAMRAYRKAGRPADAQGVASGKLAGALEAWEERGAEARAWTLECRAAVEEGPKERGRSRTLARIDLLLEEM